MEAPEGRTAAGARKTPSSRFGRVGLASTIVGLDSFPRTTSTASPSSLYSVESPRFSAEALSTNGFSFDSTGAGDMVSVTDFTLDTPSDKDSVDGILE